MYNIPANDRKFNNRQFQEAATQRKASNDTQFFWDLVARHNAGHHIGLKKQSKAQEEHFLFGKKSEETSSGIIDDSIPVQRSGPKADEITALESFESLKDVVPASVIRCIEILKFDNPTPIQKHAIPLGLAGMDLMCCAQTGSGKTLAFLIPVVTAIHNRKDEQLIYSIDSRGVLPKAIILAPTRELASQIHLDARRLTFASSLRSVCVYGGNDIRNQLMELCLGADIIVATPGRLNDLVERGIVSLSEVSFLVLDEADRMLDMGFEPQIRKIVLESDMLGGENRQTFMFSATFPPEIQTLAREFLRNYVWIAVGRVGSTVENIKQQLLLSSADPQEKVKLLLSVLDQTDGRTLVFVQKRKTASWLCDTLRNMFRIAAEEIHGDRSQAQRESALKAFRDGNIRILVATDVAARGLDVPSVTHVIQFDMPLSAEDFDVYVHRIGRTGRAGMPGLATSFFVPGREVGEGNGKIANQLLRILRENNQETPDWLTGLDDNRGGFHNHQQSTRPKGAGYNGQQSSRVQQGKFGYSDSRSNQQNVVYQGGNYGHRNHVSHDSEGFQNAGMNSAMYGRSPQVIPMAAQQSRTTNPYPQSYYASYAPSAAPIQGYAQSVPNPPPLHPVAAQNPYSAAHTSPPVMQSPYPTHNSAAYYDPYVAAYMSAPNTSIEAPSAYAQSVALQQQWIVSNGTQLPSHVQNVMPPELDRAQQGGVAYSRGNQDYSNSNGRQMIANRAQPRGYSSDVYQQDRSYNQPHQHNPRPYYNNPSVPNPALYNSGYANPYPQNQRSDYRPRDGANLNQPSPQQRYSQYKQTNHNHQYRSSNLEETVTDPNEKEQQLDSTAYQGSNGETDDIHETEEA